MSQKDNNPNPIDLTNNPPNPGDIQKPTGLDNTSESKGIMSKLSSVFSSKKTKESPNSMLPSKPILQRSNK